MLRGAAITLAVCAVALPAAWGQAELAAFEAHARTAPAACGMPVIGIYATAMLGAGGLSLAATGLGFLAWKRARIRLGWARGLELAAMAAPACLAVVGATTVAFL